MFVIVIEPSKMWLQNVVSLNKGEKTHSFMQGVEGGSPWCVQSRCLTYLSTLEKMRVLHKTSPSCSQYCDYQKRIFQQKLNDQISQKAMQDLKSLKLCCVHSFSSPNKLRSIMCATSLSLNVPLLTCNGGNVANSMPYTEAVIMEVLRFTNIATVSIPHRAKRQVTLGQYVLPKVINRSTTVQINAFTKTALFRSEYYSILIQVLQAQIVTRV